MNCLSFPPHKHFWTPLILKYSRAPDKMHILISIMPISSTNPMFDHLLKLYHSDDSNRWSNVGFGEAITQVEMIEANITHLIWSRDTNRITSHYIKHTKHHITFINNGNT